MELNKTIDQTKKASTAIDEVESLRIVCDTNIWYEFAKGTIHPAIAEKHQLIITKLSLEEIATSENLISNILLVKKTLKVVDKLAHAVIKENPFDHILKGHSSSYVPDNSQADMIMEKIQGFVQTDDTKLLQYSTNEEFHRSIRDYDSGLHLPTDGLNQLIPKFNERIRNSLGKKAHRKIQTEYLIEDLIKRIIEMAVNLYDLKIRVDWQSFPWDQFRLLIKTWDIYFKDIEVSGKMRLEKNDWVDLLNLAYVSPDMKYWTLEKKWNKIFERYDDLTNYKFTLTSQR